MWAEVRKPLIFTCLHEPVFKIYEYCTSRIECLHVCGSRASCRERHKCQKRKATEIKSQTDLQPFSTVNVTGWPFVSSRALRSEFFHEHSHYCQESPVGPGLCLCPGQHSKHSAGQPLIFFSPHVSHSSSLLTAFWSWSLCSLWGKTRWWRREGRAGETWALSCLFVPLLVLFLLFSLLLFSLVVSFSRWNSAPPLALP